MKILKNIFLPTLFFLSSILPHAFGQNTTNSPDLNPTETQPRGRNLISCSSYEAITYKKHTIADINATNGNFGQLWGQPDSITNPASWSTTYTYGINSLSYNSTDSYTQGIEILSSQWPVKVLEKEIRVGDLFSELKQKFGNNLKIIYKPAINQNYLVSFNCSGNEYDGLLIYFNPNTNKVLKIRYFVNT